MEDKLQGQKTAEVLTPEELRRLDMILVCFDCGDRFPLTGEEIVRYHTPAIYILW